MKDLVRFVQSANLDEIPVPNAVEMGRIISLQGMVLNGMGLSLLNEAQTLDGAKRGRRLADGLKLLSASRTALETAVKINEKYEPPPSELVEAREELLRVAFANGYDIAFEVDGRVTLERTVRGCREILESG